MRQGTKKRSISGNKCAKCEAVYRYSKQKDLEMGMSTHVVGIIPPTEEWLKMKAVYDACIAAKIPVPKDVMCFFRGESPDPIGVIVEDAELIKCGAIKKYSSDSESGFEVDISKVPSGVMVLRFTNSW